MTKVAACQLSLAVGQVEHNRARARHAVETAAAAGAELIVLPELVQSGYMFADIAEAESTAETVDGPTVQEWVDVSGILDVVLVAGFCEQGADATLHNSAVMIDRGRLLAVYRKVHLWDREPRFFTPGGHAPPVLDTSIGRVAMMICYDLEFPEWTRMVGLAGADILAVPTNWPAEPRPAGERPMEVVRIQAAASINRMYVVAADRCTTERGVPWVGGSVIVGPDGYPLAGPVGADRDDIIQADINVAAARDKRTSEGNDVFADRFPDLYTLR
jgi:5-aminopentanamidase